MSRRPARLMPAAILILAACADAAAPRAGAPSRPAGPPVLARLRATVDAERGTMRFDPLDSSGTVATGAAVRPAIYGDQGQTVRLYNSAVAIATVGATKTFTANVGVRNLLAWRIGDEQGKAAPTDTQGVFVVLETPPVVTKPSPCVGCTVAMTTAQGTASFDGLNQPYFYWHQFLSAFGTAGDTTAARRQWRFTASSTTVTQFYFDVSVAAAWPAPRDTSWTITYPGDSLPDGASEPPFLLVTLGGSSTVSGGSLTLSASPANFSRYYTRADSIKTSTNVVMEALFRLSSAPTGTTNAVPQAGFTIDDDSMLVGVGVNATRAGFVNAAFTGFVGTPVTVTGSVNHVYRVRKFAGDSAQLLIDGARVASLPYASFNRSTATTLPFGVAFGLVPQGTGGTATAVFDYVTYQFGRAAP